MYFNHQDKDISIIKGGKKKITRNKSYSWPGLPPYRVPLQPIASDDGTAMSKRPAMELDGRSGHWRESYSPTYGRHDAACLLGRVRDAMAIGDVATFERKPKRQFRIWRRVCALREIRNWKGLKSARMLIVPSSNNLGLIFHGMGCHSWNWSILYYYILKYTSYFWGSFKFGDLVRSHSPHWPKDAPSFSSSALSARLIVYI